MFGHGANPIFFNKKVKTGDLKHSLTLDTPLRTITSHFCLTPPTPLHPLKVDDICVSLLKDTLEALDYCKNKQKSVWSNVFWYFKVCIFWKCIQYSKHWDKHNNVKENSFGQNKQYKNALFFLPRALTRHSFTFKLRFSYELKHKICLSKTVWDFQFSILFRFYKSSYFSSTKCLDSLTLKRHNSFHN